MSKAATLADVICALQFGHEQLCRWPSTKAPAWSLEPSGIKVHAHVADKARLDPCIIADGLSKYGEQRFVWQSEAA